MNFGVILVGIVGAVFTVYVWHGIKNGSIK
jgi:hypothetical protein